MSASGGNTLTFRMHFYVLGVSLRFQVCAVWLKTHPAAGWHRCKCAGRGNKSIRERHKCLCITCLTSLPLQCWARCMPGARSSKWHMYILGKYKAIEAEGDGEGVKKKKQNKTKISTVKWSATFQSHNLTARWFCFSSLRHGSRQVYVHNWACKLLISHWLCLSVPSWAWLPWELWYQHCQSMLRWGDRVCSIFNTI